THRDAARTRSGRRRRRRRCARRDRSLLPRDRRPALGREYVAGTLSYADIAFFMAQFFASFLGAPPATSLSGVAAWRARVGARDSVRKVAGTMADYLRAQGLQLPPL